MQRHKRRLVHTAFLAATQLAELLMHSTLRLSSIRAWLLLVGLADKTAVYRPFTPNYLTSIEAGHILLYEKDDISAVS